jgi:hypothetical protein
MPNFTLKDEMGKDIPLPNNLSCSKTGNKDYASMLFSNETDKARVFLKWDSVRFPKIKSIPVGRMTVDGTYGAQVMAQGNKITLNVSDDKSPYEQNERCKCLLALGEYYVSRSEETETSRSEKHQQKQVKLDATLLCFTAVVLGLDLTQVMDKMPAEERELFFKTAKDSCWYPSWLPRGRSGLGDVCKQHAQFLKIPEQLSAAPAVPVAAALVADAKRAPTPSAFGTAATPPAP